MNTHPTPVDVEKHIAKVRRFVADLEAQTAGADHVVVHAEVLQALLTTAKAWCDVSEAIWLGKGERKH